jgi:hypothetical protein
LVNLASIALFGLIFYVVVQHKDSVGNLLARFVPSIGGGTAAAPAPASGGGGPTTTASVAGGGGWQNVPQSKLETHGFASSGKKTLREEFGVTQVGDNFMFDLRFKFAEATNDQMTLEFAGKAHSGGNDRSGYKFRLGEDGKGSYLQRQDDRSYGNSLSKSNYNLTLGHEYIARAVKQNIMSGGRCVGVHLEGWIQDLTAGGSLSKICQYDDKSGPLCSIAGSRTGARQDGRHNASVHFFIAYRQSPLSPIGVTVSNYARVLRAKPLRSFN